MCPLGTGGWVPHGCCLWQDEGRASAVPQVESAVLPRDAVLGFRSAGSPLLWRSQEQASPCIASVFLCGHAAHPQAHCCGAWSGRCPLDHTGPWHHVCSKSEDVELEAVTHQGGFFRVGLNLGCCCILAPSPLRGILQPGRASRWQNKLPLEGTSWSGTPPSLVTVTDRFWEGSACGFCFSSSFFLPKQREICFQLLW